MMLIIDTNLFRGWGSVLAAVAFFLIFLPVAFVAFKMLERTVKMVFRIAIVAIILAVAVAGSAAIWVIGTGKSEAQRPRPTRNR